MEVHPGPLPKRWSWEDSPFWTQVFHWHRPTWLAEWSVMNLLPDGAEGYTGTLFFSPLSEDNTYGHRVPAGGGTARRGDFWTVGAAGGAGGRCASPMRERSRPPHDHIPHITYAAETVRSAPRGRSHLRSHLLRHLGWVHVALIRRLGRRQDVPHRRRRTVPAPFPHLTPRLPPAASAAN